jgi:chemotaxis protein MotB
MLAFRNAFVLAPACALLLGGCVTRQDYEAVLARQAEVERAGAECGKRVAARDDENASLRRRLDQQIALSATLEKRLDQRGADAAAAQKEKNALAEAVSEARQRLDELRRAEVAAEARAALYRELAFKFQHMIDSGSLRVALRDGRMVLQLPNDVLFDSGRVELKPAGHDALIEVAAVLRTIGQRRFQVAGHTCGCQTPSTPKWRTPVVRDVCGVRSARPA